MSSEHTDEKWIRGYLLGELTQERAQELEERLLRDDDFTEQLLLVEDELIEDFARGALGAHERERFESYFLTTPRRHRKLMLVRGLRKYSSTSERKGLTPAPGFLSRLQTFFKPKWVAVAAALLIVATGIGVWRGFLYRSDVERGLLALNDAYKRQRPLEARVTGLGYAPYSVTRGNDAGNVDYRARDRSAALIQSAVSDEPSPGALHALGRVYLMQKDFDKAILQFEEALKSTPNDARLHSDLGAALLEKGKLERLSDQSGRSETTLASSLDHLNKALALDDSLLDARFNRALLYQALGLTPRALEDWERYVAQDPRSSWADEARKNIEQIRAERDKVSRRDSDLYREFTEAQQARDEERIWRVFSKSHLRTGNAITNRLIDDYLDSSSTGRREEADRLSQSLTQLGDLSRQRATDLFTADLARLYGSATPSQLKSLTEARGLMREANQLYNQSRNDQAIAHFGRAKSLFEQSGDLPEALLADFWAGHCYSQQADMQRSFSIYNDVAAHCEGQSYKWLLAITQNGLATLRTRTTQYSQAVDNGWTSYKLSSQAADENGMLRSLNTLSGLYRSLGNYRQSLRIAQQGLILANKISADASQVIGFYATSAWSFNSLGLYAAALDFEQQALSLAEVMNNNPLALSRYRVQLGLIQGRLKNYDAAIGNIRLGIEIGQGLGTEKLGQEMTTYARLYLSRLYREAGMHADALAVLNEVIEFCRQNNQPWLLHEAYKEQLLTHIAQGEVTSAGEELGRILASYEEQRGQILEESNRSSFFDKEQDIYDVAIDFAYTHLTDAQHSFEYSESSRARSLFDASAANWRVEETAGLPDLRFAGSLKPMSLEEIRRRMPARAQLLQYAVLKDRTIIWYISRERFEALAVNVGSEELTGKVERLLNLVSGTPSAADDEQYRGIAAGLYDILIRPAAPLLDPDKQLCIIPDKSLHLLPFNALFSSSTQRFLVEDFTLTYAPSANLFIHDTEAAVEKEHVRAERLLAVGNPRFDRETYPDLADLPSAAREATEIDALYDSCSLLTGPAATKTAVQVEMGRADVLHFATHYLADSTSPMLSKLLLADDPGRHEPKPSADGALQVYEFYRLKPTRARLVVLSACQTGVEGYSRSEGAVGLSRPFKAVGVPLVIASLWPVDSQVTADLMVNFHRLRKRAGLPSAEALRTAQVQMLKHPDPGYRRPHYWASFALVGGYSSY